MTIARHLAAAAAFAAVAAVPGAAQAQDAKVITLTQTGCQFLESENGVDHGYSPEKAEDCKEINARSGDERLAAADALTLSPGRYIFRVTNTNVPYELGFWLREADYNPSNPLHKLSKTSVSGGGLEAGVTRDYEVTIEEGKQYVYSCPLNPTPDYPITVQ